MLDYVSIFLLMLISLLINKENGILNKFSTLTYIDHKFIITSAIFS